MKSLVEEFLSKESIYDYSDSFDASCLNESTHLTEDTDDGICAIIPMAGGAKAIATSCRKILNVPRQNSIYDTCVEMLGQNNVYINKVHNVVGIVKDFQEAGAVMQRIYEMFGVKSSLTVTYEGKGKVYFAPNTPVDKARALEWEQDHNSPTVLLDDPRKYLLGGH